MRYLDQVSRTIRATISTLTRAHVDCSLQMCTNTPDGLLAVPNKQNCLDLCETVRDYISDTRWELGKMPILRPYFSNFPLIRPFALTTVQEAGLILQKIGQGQPATPIF